jgi:hypothetical protein
MNQINQITIWFPKVLERGFKKDVGDASGIWFIW